MLPAPQDAVDRLHQRARAERLHQHVAHAERVPLVGEPGVERRRQENDGNVPQLRRRAHGLQHGEAAHAGQVEVEQHEVRRHVARLVERPSPVRHRAHGVAADLLEHDTHQPLQADIVLDVQNFSHRMKRGPR